MSTQLLILFSIFAFVYIQLAYNPHNNLNWFRNSICLNLGYWHSYKVANEKLFRTFLPTFFGPAYHAIFPTFKIPVKPRLTHMVSFFNFMSCGYPSFRNALLELASTVRPGHRFYHDIQNLVDIFEFYLPIVGLIFLFLFIPYCIFYGTIKYFEVLWNHKII